MSATDKKPGGGGIDDVVFGDAAQEVKPKPKLDMNAPLKKSAGDKRGSILSSTDDVFDVGGAFHGGQVEKGTIVSDKRKMHVGIGEALTGAFREWYAKTSASLKDVKLFQKTEPETISAPENRKDVIAEATKHTKQVPHDDHTIVVEKMKTLSHDAERVTGKSFFLKKTEPAPVAGGASANVTPIKAGIPGSADIRSTRLQNDGVDTKTRRERQTVDLRSVSVAPKIEQRVKADIASFVKPPEEKTPRVVVKPPERPRRMFFPGARSQPLPSTPHQNIPATQTKVIHEDVVVKPTPPQPKPARETHRGWSFFVGGGHEEQEQKAPAEQPRQAATTPEVVPPIPAVPPPMPERVAPMPIPPPPEPPKQPLPTERTERTREFPPKIEGVVLPPRRDDWINTLYERVTKHALALGLIVVVGGVAGVGAALYVMDDDPEPVTEQPTVDVVSFFSTDSSVSVPFSTSRTQLINSLERAVTDAPRGVIHISLTSESGESPSTEHFFAALSTHAKGGFVRSLDEHVMIGSVTVGTNEPFFVFRTTSFDAAFAGMLEWESTMQADLAPLFGEPTEQKRTQKAKDAFSMSPFVDATKGNDSIRILYGNDKEEHMLYAFVNKNTIIVTASTEALAEILKRMK